MHGNTPGRGAKATAKPELETTKPEPEEMSTAEISASLHLTPEQEAVLNAPLRCGTPRPNPARTG